MRSVIAFIVRYSILLAAVTVVLNDDIDMKGYAIGVIVGSFAAGFAAGIRNNG